MDCNARSSVDPPADSASKASTASKASASRSSGSCVNREAIDAIDQDLPTRCWRWVSDDVRQAQRREGNGLPTLGRLDCVWCVVYLRRHQSKFLQGADSIALAELDEGPRPGNVEPSEARPHGIDPAILADPRRATRVFSCQSSQVDRRTSLDVRIEFRLLDPWIQTLPPKSCTTSRKTSAMAGYGLDRRCGRTRWRRGSGSADNLFAWRSRSSVRPAW
jgi:hypothetical protein